MMIVTALFFLLQANAGYSVLAPGSFHDDEVSPGQNFQWFALRGMDSSWDLVPVELVLKRTCDPILDEEGEATGWEVSASGMEPLLFLGADTEVFTPGPLEPVLTGTGLLSPGDSYSMGEDEELTVEDDGVFYRRGDQRQRLSNVYENLYGEGVSVVWAGDLDGDGLNDVIIDDCAHYAIYIGYRVFLSTEAGPGELLGQVAEFIAVSC